MGRFKFFKLIGIVTILEGEVFEWEVLVPTDLNRARMPDRMEGGRSCSPPNWGSFSRKSAKAYCFPENCY